MHLTWTNNLIFLLHIFSPFVIYDSCSINPIATLFHLISGGCYV